MGPMWTHRGCLCLCLCLCACLGVGCEEPHPALRAVSPNQAYSGEDVNLTLMGDNFVPATILDPDQGRRIATSDQFQVRVGNGFDWWHASAVAWLSPNRMTACLSGAMAGFGPGPLDVELVDPRGEKTILPGGFTLLGRDDVPPTLTFDGPSPAAMFAPDMLLRGRFHAVDLPMGTVTGLDWTYYENGQAVDAAKGSCPVPPQATEASCDFQVRTSTGLGDPGEVKILARATDGANPPNRAEKTLTFLLHPAPSVSAISPSSGGTLGGTDLVITGNGFVPGSTATLDGAPLFPNGGIYVDSHTLSGHVPAHAQGRVAVVVHTPLGDARAPVAFQYLAPPQILAIDPSVEDLSGVTQITITGQNFSQKTRIYFGTTLEGGVPLDPSSWKSPTLITGVVPAGHGQAWVWAFDNDLGFTKLEAPFSWRTP
jgi:hypothetical protein